MQVPFICLPHSGKLAAARPAMQIVTNADLGTLVVPPFPPPVKAWGIICCDSQRLCFTTDHHRVSLAPRSADRGAVAPLGTCPQPEFRLGEALMRVVTHFVQHCSTAPARGSSPCRAGQGSAAPHVNFGRAILQPSHHQNAD